MVPYDLINICSLVLFASFPEENNKEGFDFNNNSIQCITIPVDGSRVENLPQGARAGPP